MMIRYVFILVYLCISNFCMAQSLSFSRVGSIGTFSDGGYVSSLAISFNRNAECVKLNTGVSLFGSLLGQKEFVVFCKAVSAGEDIEFNLYPNPVVTYTRLVATGMSIAMTQLDMTIVDALGRLVRREKLQASGLRTGYVLNVGSLSAGNYFLRVEASGFNKVIPFVKVH